MNTALPVLPVHTLFDDFLWSAEAVTASPFALVGFTGGAGGVAATFETTAPTDNTYTGLFSAITGTGNNNNTRAGLQGSNGNNRIMAGGGVQVIEWRIRIPTLATVVTDFNIKVGLQDTTALGDPANGIYLYYNYNINSGKWRGVTRNASTSTNVDSASSTVVAGTWYKLKFQVNAAGTNVEFFVNDVSIGSSTATIPTTNAMRLMASIEKQGANSAVSRTLDIDHVLYRIER